MSIVKIIKILNTKIFLIILVISILGAIYGFNVSSVTAGGILLVTGAWYVYVGNIFYSTINYTMADICWLINAYHNGDIVGTITVTVGIVVGLIVTNKMRIGKFRRSLLHD